MNQAGKNGKEERVVSKAMSKPTGTNAMQRVGGEAERGVGEWEVELEEEEEEAVASFEIVVTTYQTTRCYIAYHCNLNFH